MKTLSKLMALVALVAAFSTTAKADDIFQLTWAPDQYRVCINYYLRQFYDTARDEVAAAYCDEAAEYFGRAYNGRNDWLDTYRVRTDDGQCFRVTEEGQLTFSSTENCIDWVYFVNDFYDNFHSRSEVSNVIYSMQPVVTNPPRGGGGGGH